MSSAIKSPKGVSPREPLIQITKSGTNFLASDEDLVLLRAEFGQQHWLLLPGFLDPPLLNLLQLKLDETDYRAVDRQTGVELRPVDCTAYLAAELLLNNPKLFRAIELMTGCARMACFSGRIYRRPPTSDYFNRWHSYVTDKGRMIALSINLSVEAYKGGALQIRSSTSRELLRVAQSRLWRRCDLRR